MASTQEKLSVASLTQGISQQSDQAINQSACRDQNNCLNDLLMGARARNGSRVIATIAKSWVRPFLHRITRSTEEDYLVVVEAGDLRIYNLADGTQATVTGDISAYLATSGLAYRSYSAATVEDVTFLANRRVKPAMSTTKSPVRSNHALAHFKSANYSTKYSMSVQIGSTVWNAAYNTPDNSATDNAQFVATNRLAQEFKDVFESTLIPALTAAGHPGFAIERRGSSLLIYGGTADFRVWTEDGLGGQQFIAFKDRVKDLADLPSVAWAGYLVAVGNTDVTLAHDYFLEYQGGPQDGQWVEVVGPNVATTINPATMPHAITNTALNAFTVGPATWGTRLAGDGTKSAKDPYFIGNSIVDLQFIDARLAIVGNGWYGLSRSGNGYSFFPDTVQARLDTAPIHYRITTGKVTNVSNAVVAAESLQFWANKAQIRLSSGQENIREDTVENKPITSYDYDGILAPEPVGQSSVVFGTSRGRWNNFTEVIYEGARPAGEINITGHCPNLIGGMLRQLEVSGSATMLAVLSDGLPNGVYIYQWFNSGKDRVQSAWNKWTFPSSTKVLWTGMSGSKAFVLLSWPNGVSTLEEIETEWEGDEDEYVPLRADHRVSESLITEHGDGFKVVTLPYAVPEPKRSLFVAYSRQDREETGEQRGDLLEVEWLTDTTIKVFTAVADPRFWVGAIPVANRIQAKPYLTTRDGAAMIVDEMTIMSLVVSHTQTTTYRFIARAIDGSVLPDEFSARRLDDPSIRNNKVPIEESGEETFDVGFAADEVTLELLNDTIFPSTWDSLQYRLQVTTRSG